MDQHGRQSRSRGMKLPDIGGRRPRPAYVKPVSVRTSFCQIELPDVVPDQPACSRVPRPPTTRGPRQPHMPHPPTTPAPPATATPAPQGQPQGTHGALLRQRSDGQIVMLVLKPDEINLDLPVMQPRPPATRRNSHTGNPGSNLMRGQTARIWNGRILRAPTQGLLLHQLQS